MRKSHVPPPSTCHLALFLWTQRLALAWSSHNLAMQHHPAVTSNTSTSVLLDLVSSFVSVELDIGTCGRHIAPHVTLLELAEAMAQQNGPSLC